MPFYRVQFSILKSMTKSVEVYSTLFEYDLVFLLKIV